MKPDGKILSMQPKRRRTKGSGSIILRGNVYWIEYQERGRRLRESARTSDPEEAGRILKQRIGEVAATGDVSPGRATVLDLCKLVLADYELRGLRDIQRVRWRTDAHIARLVGKLPAARFGGPSQIRQYIATRRAEKATNGTINRELGILHRGFVLGAQEEPPLVRRVPHIPKLEEAEPRRGFIEQAQYELLLAHMPDRVKCLLVVGYHFGCRIGELRKLRWDQVDFDAGVITLEASQTKGKASRVLPMYGDVREWLERQQEQCSGPRVFCYRKCVHAITKDGRPAVELPFGRHMDGWDEACTAAGLEGLLFHDLRRSAVRNMERAGIPRSVAMRISGHKTESVYRRYDIVGGGDFEEAVKRMEEYATKQKRTKLRRVK